VPVDEVIGYRAGSSSKRIGNFPADFADERRLMPDNTFVSVNPRDLWERLKDTCNRRRSGSVNRHVINCILPQRPEGHEVPQREIN
jgi:hypothetical protein